MNLNNDKLINNSKNNDESDSLLKELVLEYQPLFEGLTKEQKSVLACRKIFELRQQNGSLKEILDKVTDKNTSKLEKSLYSDLWKSEIYHVWAIMEASDLSLGLLTAFMIHENDDDLYRDLYQESLINYHQVLENYHKLAEELHLSSALELSNLFTYMLWNGYYSVNKEHNYKLQSRLLLPSMHSFDVIRGSGVCLAYAELLHNYLTVCNHQSAILNCKVSTNKQDITPGYRPEINRHHQNNLWGKFSAQTLHTLFKGLVNHAGNHAVTLISEDNHQFIYDPTNLYVLNIINDNQASIINGQGIYEMKPHFSFVNNPNCDPFYLFEQVLSSNHQSTLTKEEVIDKFEKVQDIIKSNILLLDDAYDNIHENLLNICRQTDEFGSGLKAAKKIRELKKQSLIK